MVRPARQLTVLAMLSMLLFAHPAVIAQDATPAAGEVIDPAECQVEPRAIEEIEQLVGTAGEGADATPDAAQAGSMEGEDADEATVQAVTQTYRELVACLNAGEFLRIYALYTDDYLRRTLNDERNRSRADPGNAGSGSARSHSARWRQRCAAARRRPCYSAGRNHLLA